jgi:hypothetical protein
MTFWQCAGKFSLSHLERNFCEPGHVVQIKECNPTKSSESNGTEFVSAYFQSRELLSGRHSAAVLAKFPLDFATCCVR